MEELLQDYKKSKEIIDKSPGSMYNSFRSKIYTEKGRNIGFPESWKVFTNFKEEMSDGWERGLILIRIDNTLPYSKDNCIWVEKGMENINKLVKFEYNGVTKTLIEWCDEFNLNYNGVRQRYYKGKNYTPEQVLFGKIKGAKKEMCDINKLDIQKQRDKVSKMISAYRCKDKKKGLETDLDIDFMLELSAKPCIYCGDTELIGADRIDNNCGHTKENVVPCCYMCNTARNNNFSFEEMIILGKTIKQIKDNRK